MSQSISRTDLPAFARERARFTLTVVFPSFSVALVMEKTLYPFLKLAFSIFVFISLNVSINGSPTVLSVIKSAFLSPLLFFLDFNYETEE